MIRKDTLFHLRTQSFLSEIFEDHTFNPIKWLPRFTSLSTFIFSMDFQDLLLFLSDSCSLSYFFLCNVPFIFPSPFSMTHEISNTRDDNGHWFAVDISMEDLQIERFWIHYQKRTTTIVFVLVSKNIFPLFNKMRPNPFSSFWLRFNTG